MALPTGTVAPDFTLPDANKTPVSLSSYRGKQAVLLVFYPFAFSGTCTAELCQIRNDLGSFENDDVQVLAISTDTAQSLKAWSLAQGYTFPLLSDFWPHGRTARDYGVFWEKTGFAIRGTFLVDAAGVIRWTLINGPGEARDFSGYRTAMAELRGTTASV